MTQGCEQYDMLPAWLALRMEVAWEAENARYIPAVEILGLYIGDDAEQKAVALCKELHDVVVPLDINAPSPDGMIPGAYYPLWDSEASG